MITTASSHTVAVACGSGDHYNVATTGATSLTLSLTAQGVILQYKSSNAVWYITGDDLPLGQLDARYTQLAGDLGGTTASPTVAKIQGTTIQTPPGGTTDYLRADGNWAAPSGGGGVALDTTTSHWRSRTASPGLVPTARTFRPRPPHDRRGSSRWCRFHRGRRAQPAR